MKIVIDILENDFLACKRWCEEGVAQWAEAIIANGTPIVKDELDNKEITENITQRDCDWYLSEIRWTDKLSVKSNGDIIDFEGRIVGHINLENMKGGANMRKEADNE